VKNNVRSISRTAVAGATSVAAHFVAGPIVPVLLRAALVAIDTYVCLGVMVNDAFNKGRRDFSIAIDVD